MAMMARYVEVEKIFSVSSCLCYLSLTVFFHIGNTISVLINDVVTNDRDYLITYNLQTLHEISFLMMWARDKTSEWCALQVARFVDY